MKHKTEYSFTYIIYNDNNTVIIFMWHSDSYLFYSKNNIVCSFLIRLHGL